MFVLIASLAFALPQDLVGDDLHLVWNVAGLAGSNYGWALADLADIDGDGVTDAIVGAPTWSDGVITAGATFVVSGATGAELWRFEGTEDAGFHGYAMVDVGDADGDGIHDIGTGAPTAGPGTVWVYSGATGETLLEVQGEEDGDGFGGALAAAGDVDGDGAADFMVGAPTAGGALDAGTVSLVSGADGTILRVWTGASTGDYYGGGTGTVGDLTGDGVPEVAVSVAYTADGGQVWVLDPTTAEPVRGPMLGNRQSTALGQFFVGGPGDVDGDGVLDVYAGDPAAASGDGAAWVYSGVDGETLLVVKGTSRDGLGCGRGVPDVDGDGLPDLALGAWSSGDLATAGGKFVLVSGRDGTVLQTITNGTASENFGFDAVSLGDVDGDGRQDILIGGATGAQLYLLSAPLPPPPDTTDTGDPADSAAAGDADDEIKPPAGCGCGSAPGAQGVWAGAVLATLLRRRKPTQS